MRVGICGGGPAGLQLAIVLKRADPAHQVVVYERDPPGATYGWGVVFSDESLADLRDADYETYLALDEALVRWGSIEVVRPGERLRSRGHGFAAIARVELLSLLAARARALGVDLRHETPVTHPPDLAGEHDLLVGADGVHSLVRETAGPPGWFGTTLTHSSTRFAWFGAELAFDVFTFIFQPTAHGLFQAHAYPFDARRSTFIVECTDDTWRRAGLDAMSEAESVGFCQDLFAEHLRGRALRANRSPWARFPTLRNRRWHLLPPPAGGHRTGVVLVGDAAHTAHFSIGSGTRLAMDDAIALGKATVAHPGNLAAALADYEAVRQPVVDRFQQAAAESARYFESVARTLPLPLPQFAFHLLTRSGRLGRLELERRDPRLVNLVDRRFAGCPGRLVPPPPHLVALPLTSGCGLPNRVVLAPPAPDSARDGLPGEDHLELIRRSSATGAGLVVTEAVAVSPAGRVTPGSAGLWDDAQAVRWASVVEAAHREGALVAVRLSHAGRRGATAPRRRGLDRPLGRGAWPLLAPSPVPYTARSQVPAEMDEPAMAEVAAAFSAATGRAADAGFDVVLLDWSDGYLLASFLSPLSNRRGDDHGGSLAGRARFPLAVLAGVGRAWPAERPLAVRLTVSDRLPGGLVLEEGVALARLAADAGCALVEVTAGHTVAGRGLPDYRRLFNADLADAVRNEAGVKVLVGGRITLLDEVATLVASGRADACVLDPVALCPSPTDPDPVSRGGAP